MENQNEQNVEEEILEPQTKTKKNSVLFSILSWVVTIAVGVGLALLVNSFILINAQVISGSMQNTLLIGDRLMGTRFAYWLSEPQRGDIIVFNYPVEEALGKKDEYIKRIIGLPGEKVEIREAKIYINDSEVPLNETYLKEEWTRKADGLIFNVPENCYFVLGDNRNNSKDSRYWASEAMKYNLAKTEEEALTYSFVKKSQILGKAYFCYWPLGQLKWYSRPDYYPAQ